jgi:tetratricopeptide (TPR) repeat protein
MNEVKNPWAFNKKCTIGNRYWGIGGFGDSDAHLFTVKQFTFERDGQTSKPNCPNPPIPNPISLIPFLVSLTMRLLPLLLILLLPGLMSGQNKKQKKLYAAYVVSGDSAFDAKNYTFAKDKYKLAAGIKPNESYPTKRIEMCDKLVITQGVEYKKYVLLGDSCAEKQDWQNAKMYYLKASAAKPHEQYASAQAKNCNYRIVSEVALDDLYEEQLQRGDSCFNAKSWACAKANYEAASRTKPEEQYPKDRAIECGKKMTPAVTDERYQLMITDADAQYAGGNYLRAKQLYEEALTIKPGAKYALERIALCEQKIKEDN